jgi:glucose dehydrogenase
LVLVSGSALLLSSALASQNNWTSFGQDPGGSKFSTLAQINTSNVKDLKRAWTFHRGNGRRRRSRFHSSRRRSRGTR